jgi:hypothetical protein
MPRCSATESEDTDSADDFRLSITQLGSEGFLSRFCWLEQQNRYLGMIETIDELFSMPQTVVKVVNEVPT